MVPPTGTDPGLAFADEPPDDDGSRVGLTDDDLAPGVADRHLRLDVDVWEQIYVVGDVHGCRRELEALLSALDPSGDDLVLIVGDLIRKGPDSLGVVELVRETPNVFSIRVNNEAKQIHDRVDLPELDPVADYVESLPVVISFGDSFLVHGGVDTRMPLSDQGIERLLTPAPSRPRTATTGRSGSRTTRGRNGRSSDTPRSPAPSSPSTRSVSTRAASTAARSPRTTTTPTR